MIIKMKKIKFILAAVLGFALAGCSYDYETGADYPALSLEDGVYEYELSAVMQNSEDIKPYLDFFGGVKFSITYVDGNPASISFSEEGVPFRVTDFDYDGTFVTDCEIYTRTSPYELRVKGTDQVICHISADRTVTFTFTLGAPSNTYEYQFALASDNAGAETEE